MKTIHDYLKEYGKYTFFDKEFNEVDNVILSLLSYIDFFNIVPTYGNGSITLKKASMEFYKKYDKKDIDKNILAVREASYLLKELAETKRFKDLELLNYDYQITFDMQFGALCIKLPDKTMYVSFEGTDSYVSGWEEDFMLVYKFPIRAQEVAINYLNQVVGLFGPKVYVGGHSKGGNLALVSSMFCKHRVFRKIKHVYSNDGPGLRLKEFESNRYRRVSYKFSHIVPNDSFIGLLLRNDDNFTVVKSTKKKFMQHNAMTWIVEDDHFKKSEEGLSEFSKKIRKTLLSWLDKFDDKRREDFVRALFSILKKSEITDLNDIKEAKISNMLKVLKEMKNISKDNRTILTDALKDLYSEWKN